MASSVLAHEAVEGIGRNLRERDYFRPAKKVFPPAGNPDSGHCLSGQIGETNEVDRLSPTSHAHQAKARVSHCWSDSSPMIHLGKLCSSQVRVIAVM